MIVVQETVQCVCSRESGRRRLLGAQCLCCCCCFSLHCFLSSQCATQLSTAPAALTTIQSVIPRAASLAACCSRWHTHFPPPTAACSTVIKIRFTANHPNRRHTYSRQRATKQHAHCRRTATFTSAAGDACALISSTPPPQWLP